MKKQDNNVCGAKTKATGKPCQKTPVPGSTRCHLHGGKSLKGTQSKRYKHGLYSRYAGSSLKAVLHELEEIPSEELTNVDDEIKLLQALIISSKTLQKQLTDLEDLSRLSDVVSKLIIAKQRAMKIQLEQERLLPAKDVKKFLSWMEDLLEKQIGVNEATLIMSQLYTFKISDHENG